MIRSFPITFRGSGSRSGSRHPRPLRTVRAPFNAYSSSIGQRALVRHAVTPIGLGVNLSVMTTVPATDMSAVVEAAPARIITIPRPICVASYAGWLPFHARQHQREVCPLARGVMSQPLSDPLQTGIRFLPPPLPAAPSAHLTTRFPSREGYGLTTLRHGNRVG
jgi:hypothetical protein